ncbi:MAG: hypothetical protein ACFFCG_13715, partial [Promethearchaeota archaeon]
YNQFIKSFSLKKNSKFSDISIDPKTPIYGQKFNITSVLTTEFSDKIPNKNVTLQFFNISLWENVSTQITNINGSINFEIDSLLFPSEYQFKFRLLWHGDQYTLANSQNITIPLFRAFNNISLRITSNVDQLFKNRQSTIQIILNNIGDSELNVLIPNISIQISPTLSYSIVQINYMMLAEFKPGDTTIILIKIDIPTIDQMSISVSIEARNEITEEQVLFQTSEIFDIYDAMFEDLIINYFMVIMIGIFAIVWTVMIIYVRRTIKKLETPLEEPTKARPRKGKYVSVSELPTETMAQKVQETPAKKPKKLSIKRSKKPKDEEKEKPSTDLDSLLEEEGLKD